MIHRKLMAAAALASLTALAACGQNADEQRPEDQDAEAVNVAQDAAGAVVGLGSASTIGANTVEGYVTNAAIADMYEIQAAQIALERTQNARIRDVAQMMIKDHTEMSNALKAAVSEAGVQVTIPTELDERRKGMIDNLRGASDADFDDRYLDQQTMAHHEALTLHNGYASMGDNEALKRVAAAAAPRIETHTERVTRLDRNSPADDEAGATGH